MVAIACGLYFELRALFVAAVSLRNLIFGDVV